ncbi:hypothetical protein, partial [Streptomyces sp. NPDC059071]|uniref:hypothetical protein n=1 Tax=Streptomyces sp. NPDC059071 TaxID=3346714 RepID=UPI00369E715B
VHANAFGNQREKLTFGESPQINLGSGTVRRRLPGVEPRRLIWIFLYHDLISPRCRSVRGPGGIRAFRAW